MSFVPTMSPRPSTCLRPVRSLIEFVEQINTGLREIPSEKHARFILLHSTASGRSEDPAKGNTGYVVDFPCLTKIKYGKNKWQVASVPLSST